MCNRWLTNCIVWGGVGIRLFAVGGIAVGFHAMGGVAVAAELAAGGVATVKVAIENVAYGEHALLTGGTTSSPIKEFILQQCPDMWRLILSRMVCIYFVNVKHDRLINLIHYDDGLSTYFFLIRIHSI
jgi:hypothetical protein